MAQEEEEQGDEWLGGFVAKAAKGNCRNWLKMAIVRKAMIATSTVLLRRKGPEREEEG